jgi:Gas vesicle synthesis protein GvpL/GvpF
MDQTPPSNTGTYIYCVTRAQPFAHGGSPLATSGLGGHDQVRILTHDDLAAVVSDAPQDQYDISRENLLAHQRVLTQALTRSEVLPVSFGTVAASDQEVQELLHRAADALHRSLEDVRGRIEVELRVLWHEERLFADIVAENEDIRALRDRLAGQAPAATHYERIQLGEMVAAALERKSAAEAAALLDALEPLAVATRVNKNLGDMMLLNAAFLVNRSQEPAFDAQVQALGEVQVGRLIFRYVGPLPPYNFVDIRVPREEEPEAPF